MKKYLYTLCLLLLVSSQANAQEKKVKFQQTKNNYVSVFDQLQNGEQFRINYASSGCFHQIKEMMIFEKENDTYYTVFQNKRKKLSVNDIKKIQQFEKELSIQNNAGCTTVDTYFITYNGTSQSVTDGSCGWNGYHNLKKAFGFKS